MPKYRHGNDLPDQNASQQKMLDYLDPNEIIVGVSGDHHWDRPVEGHNLVPKDYIEVPPMISYIKEITKSFEVISDILLKLGIFLMLAGIVVTELLLLILHFMEKIHLPTPMVITIGSLFGASSLLGGTKLLLDSLRRRDEK